MEEKNNKMMKISLIGENENKVICENVFVADSFSNRLKGLMFKSDLKQGEGMLITSCNSIHTFFMLFSIDAIFLDRNYKVIKIYSNLKPWRMTSLVFGATQVLEIKAQTIPFKLAVGDKLEAICIN